MNASVCARAQHAHIRTGALHACTVSLTALAALLLRLRRGLAKLDRFCANVQAAAIGRGLAAAPAPAPAAAELVPASAAELLLAAELVSAAELLPASSAELVSASSAELLPTATEAAAAGELTAGSAARQQRASA